MISIRLTAAIALAIALGVARPADAASPLQPQVGDAETYAETYSVIVDTPEGIHVLVRMGVSNVGVGDGKGACSIRVFEPGKKPWEGEAKVDRDGWKFVSTPYPALHMSKCVLRGGAVVEAITPLGGGEVRIQLYGQLKVQRPAGSRVDVDGKFFQWETFLPWAEAQLTLNIPGRPKRTLKGFGALDHNRSTTMPRDPARRWVRVRSFDADGAVRLRVRYPAGEGTGPRGWLWREGEAKPVALKRFRLTTRKVDGKSRWVAEATTDAGLFTFEATRMLLRDAPIDNMGAGGFLIKSVVGNPVTYTYEATLSGPGIPAARSAVMEIANTNED